MQSKPSQASKKALDAIAIFEGIKGLAAIAASLGLLTLAHRDVRALAYALMGHFNLDPEAHSPRMLLDQASSLANASLRQVVRLAGNMGVVAYMVARLWRRRGQQATRG